MINAVQVLFINDTHDFRSRRPAVLVCFIWDSVKFMFNMDSRSTVRIIADELGISCSTVHGILTEELGMSAVNVRSITRDYSMTQSARYNVLDVSEPL